MTTTMIQCVLDRPADLSASHVGPPLNEQLHTVVVSPAGEVRSRVGMFLMDAEAAQMVVADFNAHGTDLLIDFEHHSEGDALAAPDGLARAAGWIGKLWFDPERGLLGQVKWNDRARELIRADEYRYLSPSMLVRVSDRRPVLLKSVGLTNIPAIPGMEKVAASRKTLLVETDTENLTMADQPATTVATTERLLGELKAALASKGTKLADTATRDDIITAAIKAISGEGDTSDKSGDDKAEADVTATARTVLGLPVGAPVSAVKVGLHEIGRLRSEVETLRNTAAGATASLATRRVEDLVRQHIDAGRIREADTEDLAACRKLARENPTLFESMMSRRELPTPGRVVKADEGFDKRSEIIASTKVRYGSEKTLQGLTSLAGLVNTKLKDAGLATLSESEAKTL